jgi:asparagine synthase (glutamine-hydrolysing)
LVDENTPAIYDNTYLTIKRKSRVNFNTFYKSILEVQPGQIIKINKSLESFTKKFKYLNYKNIKNIPETQKSLRDELILAVSRWVASDIPISLSLSGGLDSSILAGILSKELGIKPRCYTFELIGGEAESELAEKTADLCGLELIKCSITESEYFEEIDVILRTLEEPYFGDLPSWFVYKKAHAYGEKVILTGTGADELFGNYNKGRKSISSYLKSIIKYIASSGQDKNPCNLRDAYGYFPNEISPAVYNRLFSTQIRTSEGFSINENLERCNLIYEYDKKGQLRSEFLMMTDKLSSAFYEFLPNCNSSFSRQKF